MESLNENFKDLWIKLYDIGALKFGQFKLKSQLYSPVYIDLRLIISYPAIMEAMASLVLETVQSKILPCDVLCGVPYTALPIATLVSAKSGVPMLIRRKEAKNYGTGKLVEGCFNAGDNCLIIEDVVTTGSSVLETAEDLRKEGLFVKDVIVILDRGQDAGKNFLAKNGITMHSLCSLTQVLHFLTEAGKIEKSTADPVHRYLSTNQNCSRYGRNSGDKTRLSMPFLVRARRSSSPLAARLLTIMAVKETTLCIAADVTTSAELLSLAESVAPHICLLKTHIDAITDFTADVATQLAKIAFENDYLIMEDRKYGDIGNTVRLQYERVLDWADMVTVHAVAGPGMLEALSEAETDWRRRQGEMMGEVRPRGVLVVAQMSCRANLITPKYTQDAVGLATSHPFLVAGLVCQSADVFIEPGLIQLTPGIKIAAESGASGDGFGQQYVSPREAVLERGADVVVVGRGVTKAPRPDEEAKRYRDQLWVAYLERLKA